MNSGKIRQKFLKLAQEAELSRNLVSEIIKHFTSVSQKVEMMICSSYMDDSTKSSYLQAYNKRLKLFLK
ncbi:MAG: hypothetical protein PHH30_03785 [Bacteroidales bacterium]|nr:hypothetical protein [Bacteroidales bacterium]